MMVKRADGSVAVSFTHKGKGGILEVNKNREVKILRWFD